MATRGFVDLWDEGENSFADDPPTRCSSFLDTGRRVSGGRRPGHPEPAARRRHADLRRGCPRRLDTDVVGAVLAVHRSARAPALAGLAGRGAPPDPAAHAASDRERTPTLSRTCQMGPRGFSAGAIRSAAFGCIAAAASVGDRRAERHAGPPAGSSCPRAGCLPRAGSASRRGWPTGARATRPPRSYPRGSCRRSTTWPRRPGCRPRRLPRRLRHRPRAPPRRRRRGRCNAPASAPNSAVSSSERSLISTPTISPSVVLRHDDQIHHADRGRHREAAVAREDLPLECRPIEADDQDLNRADLLHRLVSLSLGRLTRPRTFDLAAANSSSVSTPSLWSLPRRSSSAIDSLVSADGAGAAGAAAPGRPEPPAAAWRSAICWSCEASCAACVILAPACLLLPA